jgi:hypothetical protein
VLTLRITTESDFRQEQLEVLHKTRHQNIALRDRAPESDFRGYFSDTETKLDEGNTAISRHFERGTPFAISSAKSSQATMIAHTGRKSVR